MLIYVSGTREPSLVSLLAMDSTLISPTALLTILVVACLLFFHVCQPARSRNITLPPGPRPLPMIGNLLSIPMVRPWEAYRELSKRYGIHADFRLVTLLTVDSPGSIISLRALGRTMIVVDDHDIAVELLEKRSSIYSSRLQSTTIDL